jgi:hypothetical protein
MLSIAFSEAGWRRGAMAASGLLHADVGSPLSETAKVRQRTASQNPLRELISTFCRLNELLSGICPLKKYILP